jgi:hypothetical protein
MGLRGLLITTEEKRDALERRIVSNRAVIPYKVIVEKFDEKLLQPEQLTRYRDVRAQLSSQLTIVEWLGDRCSNNHSANSDLLRKLQLSPEFGCFFPCRLLQLNHCMWSFEHSDLSCSFSWNGKQDGPSDYYTSFFLPYCVRSCFTLHPTV